MKLSLRNLWKQQPVKLLIKILVSALALWLVYQRVHVHKVLTQIVKTPAGCTLVALGLFNLSQIVSAARLQLFLRQENIQIPFAENLKLYYQGMYYNLLLPGGIGGDGYKVYRFKTALNIPVKKSVRALLADRINGATALMALAGILALFVPLQFRIYMKIWIALGIILLLFLAALTLIEFFTCYIPVWWHSLLYSFIVQCLQIAAAMALLIGLKVPLNEQVVYLLVFMAGSLASVIPVTIGGLGARELIFLFSAKYFALNPESAVTLSALFFALTVVSALPGAFLRANITAEQNIGVLT